MNDSIYSTVTSVLIMVFIVVAMVWGTYVDSTMLKIIAKLEALEAVQHETANTQEDMEGSMQCLCVTSMGAP